MNAVLQDSVNAASIVETGLTPCALWKGLPSTVTVDGQLAGDEGVNPCPCSAENVSTLNVEPGG